MKRFLLILMLILAACGESVDYPHERDSAEKLIDTAYAGTAYAFSGEGRAFSLLLEENGQEELVYKLAVAYIDQSSAPTIRSGHWYSDGETLTLLIEEQDGEPTDQPPLVFAIDGLELSASEYDTERFDFKPFLLSGEDVD